MSYTWILGLIVALATTQGVSAQATYYIDEGTDYTGNGCEGPDLNTVTSTLKSAMDSNGWSGVRYTNAGTYPMDWWESCDVGYGNGWAAGWDDTQVDTKTLAVFAGHATPGDLYFPTQYTYACDVDMGSQMRLGSMNGNEAGIAMYLACEELQIASLPNEANWSWLRQQLGFRNIIGIGDNEPRDFFNATSASTNTTAWLNQMDEGGRQPIAVSYDTDSTACNNTRNTAKLKGNVLRSDRAAAGPMCTANQPSFYYCYSYI